MESDEELRFAEDDVASEDAAASLGAAERWRVLIVDDDPDVHTATAFAMRDLSVLDRHVSFLHANSAAEAHELLKRERNIAVVLLDVVMESGDAGLRLVRVIRDDLKLNDTRIILRTGQPGYAPEMQAIREYDINDYKTKSELTRTKLFTTLTSAIRSYQQITSIDRNRRALSLVARASTELMARSGIHELAAAGLTYLSDLLGVSARGVLCVQYRSAASESVSPPIMILSGLGAQASMAHRGLHEVTDAALRNAVQKCCDEERSEYKPDSTTLFLSSRDQYKLAVYIDAPSPDDADSHHLIELLCSSIAAGMDNAMLFASLHDHAYTDPLTALPNRLSLIAQLDHRLAAPDRAQYSLALIDVDHFAEANDALGHGFGDRLLRAVAQRLKSALGARCQFSRISGDTFGALGLVEDLLPASLLRLFEDPFVIEGQEMMITVTLGVAHLTDIDGNGTDAVKCANLALRRAKIGHRGEYSFYTRDMAVAIRERVRLLQALRQAIERQRLFLMYQPQFSLLTGKVCGIEALLRWRTEDGQLIPPDRFVPIAEHSGLIIHIGEWVMRTACLQQAQLASQGYPELRIAINVSVIQLRHPGFMSVLTAALKDSGANPRYVELEITESVAMEEVAFVSGMLDQIKALGVCIALDDFGTGFSSLSYLQRLNIDRLKIDRSFVNDISQGGRAQKIPELVIQLGQKLGLAVIAEGVETQEQAQILRDMGCDEAQGYLYARPLEVPMLTDFLKAELARRS